tara:strand:+ start:96 stop:221 length:126 start_codon:yes stop_codon:yes gene_type:complete
MDKSVHWDDEKYQAIENWSARGDSVVGRARTSRVFKLETSL